MDRGVIYRATAADEDPTPEALVYEVLSIVQSGSARCKEAVSFLAYRMRKNDVNIKYKTLRLCIRMLQKDAHDHLLESEFRRMAKRDLVDVVRCLRGFTLSRPHPTKGDEPARRIRQAAQQFLELLYRDDNSAQRPPAMHEHNLRPAGDVMRDDRRDTNEYVRGSYPQTGRMEGFGNPNFPDPRLQADNVSTIRTVFETISNKLPISLASTFGWPSKSNDNTFLTHAQNPNAHIGHYPPINARSREYAMAAFPANDYEASSSVTAIGSSARVDDFHTRNTRRQSRPVLQPADAGEYEWCVLEKILEPGGAKLAPSASDIREFCQDVCRLNLETVWSLLFGVIGDSEERWQKRYRALALLDGMLSSMSIVQGDEKRGLGEACASLLTEACVSSLEEVRGSAPQCKHLVATILSKRKGGTAAAPKKTKLTNTDLLGLEEAAESDEGTRETFLPQDLSQPNNQRHPDLLADFM